MEWGPSGLFPTFRQATLTVTRNNEKDNTNYKGKSSCENSNWFKIICSEIVLSLPGYAFAFLSCAFIGFLLFLLCYDIITNAAIR